MHTKLTQRVLMVALLAIVGLPQHVSGQGAETVIEWNRILLGTLGTPGAADPTVFVTRPMAMVNLAMFDALNSIDPVYTPYVDRVTVPESASRDAAAGQAAHDVLTALFPTQGPVYATALATQIRGIPVAAAKAGARVGTAAAQAILDRRANDGWNRLQPPYLLPSVAGFWQPVPPQNAPAAFAHYPDVVPFVIGSARQFLVEPPPALTSERYAADFNEEKAIGAINSSTRTADQTLVARLFAGVGTTTGIPVLWINLTRNLVRSNQLNGLDAARLFALMNMTFHDALFASFSGKFLYGLWRPVTAIREAHRDGNPATEADPNWTALLATPPYPTYPGNYACLSSAMSRVLARFFGRDDLPFSITWAESNGPGWTRSYNGFRQFADEAARSRVYGGIHFTFDTTASVGVCVPLGDYVFENELRRIP